MGSLHQRTFAQAPISDQRQPTTIGDRLFDGAFICRARASRVLATQHTSVDEGISNTGGICWHVCYLTYVPFSEYNCTLFGILPPVRSAPVSQWDAPGPIMPRNPETLRHPTLREFMRRFPSAWNR